MKPYIMEVMREASENGSPVMRAMFYEFPEDSECWDADDQYMFGGRYLVAPVLFEGVTARTVYLPAGRWKDIRDGKIYEGGRRISANAPVEVYTDTISPSSIPSSSFAMAPEKIHG